MNNNNNGGRDPGPAARFEAMKRDPYLLAEVVQRLAEGWTLYGIAREWQIPHGELCDWLKEQAALLRRKAVAAVQNYI